MDSQNVIKRIKGEQQRQMLMLVVIMEEIHHICTNFSFLPFQHVYRERNVDADGLSRAGVMMLFGSWFMSEKRDGDVSEYYRPPFHELSRYESFLRFFVKTLTETVWHIGLV